MAEKRFSETEDAHLHLWQKRQFQMTNNKDDVNLKVDCLRDCMQHVSIAEQSKSLSSAAATVLLTDYGTEYASVMDSKEGTNNYSDEALHLCRFRQSADSKWKSSLDPKNLSAIPFVREFLEQRQQATDAAKEEEFVNALRSEYEKNGDTDFFSTPLLLVEKFPDQVGVPRRPISTDAQPPPPRQQSVRQTVSSYSNIDRGQRQLPPTHQPLPSFKNGASSRSANEEVENDSSRSGESGAGGKRKWPSHQKSEREDDIRKRCKDFAPSPFRTAGEQLSIDSRKAGGTTSFVNKKSLGGRGGQLRGQFVSPLISREIELNGRKPQAEVFEVDVDPRLANIDPPMVERIRNEIMDHGPPIKWDDIAGLEFAKKTIKEIVVLPMLRPDIFTGLRAPAKGLLLFGPPGTGKTLIGKCIACQAKATFFSISASTLTSKWVGEGEKMVRALFAVARCHQPAVIFIDEIDSLLNQRSDTEHESSRRMKTEFLVQLDGATTDQENERILVVGATNRPHELDEAARRRLSKRLYVPLPELEARVRIMRNLLASQHHDVNEEQFHEIGRLTEGYSGADMANLCRDAALGPTRQVSVEDIEWIPADEVGPILFEHFLGGLSLVKASVSERDLDVYVDFNRRYGCTPT